MSTRKAYPGCGQRWSRLTTLALCVIFIKITLSFADSGKYLSILGPYPIRVNDISKQNTLQLAMLLPPPPSVPSTPVEPILPATNQTVVPETVLTPMIPRLADPMGQGAFSLLNLLATNQLSILPDVQESTNTEAPIHVQMLVPFFQTATNWGQGILLPVRFSPPVLPAGHSSSATYVIEEANPKVSAPAKP